MQHLKLSELKTPAPGRERRQTLMLVPGPIAAGDPRVTAAQARVRHGLLRALQEFLDECSRLGLEHAGDPRPFVEGEIRQTVTLWRLRWRV